MLLSIIIPIYNVEKYLDRCLLSCLQQKAIDKDEYEIILVNDGSQDNSLTIAQDYESKFTNIQILNQENQGLSMARNNGLKLAMGEYIWFVDSDDWIEEDSLKNIFPYLKDGLDMLQIQYRYAYDNPSLDYLPKPYIVDGIKRGKEQMQIKCFDAPAQFTIYRRNFLIKNDLHFVKGIFHEDIEFKPRAMYLARKVASVPNICYNYYQRKEGAITSSFSIRNANGVLFALNSLYDFSQPLIPKEQVPFNNCISLDFNTLANGIKSLEKNNRQEIIKYLKRNRKIFKRMLKASVFKYKIEGLIFYLSPNFGFKFYDLFK